MPGKNQCNTEFFLPGRRTDADNFTELEDKEPALQNRESYYRYYHWSHSQSNQFWAHNIGLAALLPVEVLADKR
jgi:hypothetical protein